MHVQDEDVGGLPLPKFWLQTALLCTLTGLCLHERPGSPCVLISSYKDNPQTGWGAHVKDLAFNLIVSLKVCLQMQLHSGTLVVQWLGLLLPLLGPQFNPLSRELRSWEPRSTAKGARKQKRKPSTCFSILRSHSHHTGGQDFNIQQKGDRHFQLITPVSAERVEGKKQQNTKILPVLKCHQQWQYDPPTLSRSKHGLLFFKKTPKSQVLSWNRSLPFFLQRWGTDGMEIWSSGCKLLYRQWLNNKVLL